jgi:type IV pilus assembly protein PilX
MKPYRAACRSIGNRNGKPEMQCGRQEGASLIVSLLMLVVIMLLGLSATQIALQSEKASRNDRDRQIAFQAAEAALLDAELDIENSPDPARSRSAVFSKNNTHAFIEGCAGGDANPFLGLCARVAAATTPAWLTVDFLNNTATATSVPFGKFTGQTFQTGQGSLPARLPRYIVELLPYNGPGESAELSARTYFYRVTAIGFGMQDTTRVVLQTFYRKED